MADQEFPMIGPHEGREFELLESQQKHVAFFHEVIPSQVEAFKSSEDYAVIEWQVTFSAFGRQETTIPYVILYRVGYEEQAERLHYILNHYERGFDRFLEREIGQILGYPQEAIECYIMGVLSRN